jgi:hypothetical protein
VCNVPGFLITRAIKDVQICCSYKKTEVYASRISRNVACIMLIEDTEVISEVVL